MATMTPGYWHCPRCSSKDLYKAPRQVGTMGFGRSFDGFDSNPDLESVGFAQRSLEKEVLLCRACGERAVYVKRVKHYTKAEQKSNDVNFGIFMLVIGIGSAISVRDTGQDVPGLAFFGIIAGLISGAFGFLFFSKSKGNEKSKSFSSVQEIDISCPVCKTLRPPRIKAGRCDKVNCPDLLWK